MLESTILLKCPGAWNLFELLQCRLEGHWIADSFHLCTGQRRTSILHVQSCFGILSITLCSDSDSDIHSSGMHSSFSVTALLTTYLKLKHSLLDAVCLAVPWRPLHDELGHMHWPCLTKPMSSVDCLVLICPIPPVRTSDQHKKDPQSLKI